MEKEEEEEESMADAFAGFASITIEGYIGEIDVHIHRN